MRLYSADHADLYISNERDALTSELIDGIPHSLILNNSNGERSILVAADKPVRPQIGAVPFSTELVVHRVNKAWALALENHYYVFPVHISLSFLYSTTLASALYLLLLRFLRRQYKSVVRLVDTVASGRSAQQRRESHTLLALNGSADEHPDAHACFLHISLVLRNQVPWDLTYHMSSYIDKLGTSRVSAASRRQKSSHCCATAFVMRPTRGMRST